MVQNASLLKESPRTNKRKASLVLKYVEEGESLWNTAKLYGSSVKEIEEANSLNPGEALKTGKLLLIPIEN